MNRSEHFGHLVYNYVLNSNNIFQCSITSVSDWPDTEHCPLEGTNYKEKVNASSMALLSWYECKIWESSHTQTSCRWRSSGWGFAPSSLLPRHRWRCCSLQKTTAASSGTRLRVRWLFQDNEHCTEDMFKSPYTVQVNIWTFVYSTFMWFLLGS